MEECPSGLRSQSWKLVMSKGTVGSNPTSSATWKIECFNVLFFFAQKYKLILLKDIDLLLYYCYNVEVSKRALESYPSGEGDSLLNC